MLENVGPPLDHWKNIVFSSFQVDFEKSKKKTCKIMQEAKSKVLFPHVVVHMLLVFKKLCLRYKKILQKVHPLHIFSGDALLRNVYLANRDTCLCKQFGTRTESWS